MKRTAEILCSLSAVLVMASMVAAATVSNAGKQFLLEEEPEGATDVIPIREEAKHGKEVVVTGRIGGRKNPWIKGAAAFMLVDHSLTPCNETENDSTCPTPWDYCCSPDLAHSMVLVMIVDGEGKLVRKDARELLGLQELDTVMIQGTAKRDKSGNLTILGSRIFVPQDDEARQ